LALAQPHQTVQADKARQIAKVGVRDVTQSKMSRKTLADNCFRAAKLN